MIRIPANPKIKEYLFTFNIHEKPKLFLALLILFMIQEHADHY